MPIEIRELHIRVTVNPDAGKQAPTPANPSPEGSAAADKDAIIAECVEQIVEIIQARRER